jgi:hypothetical protein
VRLHESPEIAAEWLHEFGREKDVAMANEAGTTMDSKHTLCEQDINNLVVWSARRAALATVARHAQAATYQQVSPRRVSVASCL